MNTFIYIIGMLLIGVVCYFLGLKTGITGSQHLYEDGWAAAEDYFKRFPVLVQDLDDLNEKSEMDSNQKYEKAKQLVKELDELFDPECSLPEEAFPDPPKDDDIYDCGQY